VTIPRPGVPVLVSPIPPRRSASPKSLAALMVCLLCFGSAAQKKPHQGKEEKPYALIFGTVWGPDDHPIYGVKVKIRRADQKKAHWELYSDHHGEFAQRLPAGRMDYVVWADLKGYHVNGKPLRLEKEVPVHIEYDERADIGLHLKQ
jgi:hypothetical protein